MKSAYIPNRYAKTPASSFQGHSGFFMKKKTNQNKKNYAVKGFLLYFGEFQRQQGKSWLLTKR